MDSAGRVESSIKPSIGEILLYPFSVLKEKIQNVFARSSAKPSDSSPSLKTKSMTIEDTILKSLEADHIIETVEKLLKDNPDIELSVDALEKCIDQANSIGDVKPNTLKAKVETTFLKVFPKTALNYINQAFELALKGLGYYEMKESGDISKKYEFIVKVIGYPSLIFAAVTALLAVSTTIGVIITGAILLAAVVALAVYLVYLKKTPDSVEGFNKIASTSEKAIYEYEKEITKLLAQLKEKQGIVLDEKSVDIDDFLEELSRYLASQHLPPQFAEFKNKKIFFAKKDQEIDLNKLSTELKGYTQDVIIVFQDSSLKKKEKLEEATVEDITKAAQKREKKLKKKFGQVQSKFPYSICLASKPETFRKSFIKKEQIPKDRLKLILADFLEEKVKDIRIDDGIIDYLMNELKDNPHAMETKFLKALLEKTLGKILQYKSPYEDQLAEIRLQILTLQTESRSLGGNLTDDKKVKLKQLLAEEKSMVSIDKENVDGIDKMKKIQIFWNEKKTEMFALANEIKSLNEKGKDTTKLQKKWVLLAEKILPSLSKAMSSIEKNSNLKVEHTKLSREVLNVVLEEIQLAEREDRLINELFAEFETQPKEEDDIFQKIEEALRKS